MCSVYDEPPAINGQRGWRFQREQMLSCRAARQQAPGAGAFAARSRQGWHEDPKERSFLGETAERFASTSKLGKRGALAKDHAQLLEFWAVAVDPGCRRN